MDINKIYIIGINENRNIEISKQLKDINNDYKIASRFTTSQDYAEIDSSDKFLYYISEDQLNLDFKNNALLYVLTDSETQESTGIAIDEFYNCQIIPITIKAFNTIKKENLENTLVVWFDSIMNKSDYSNIDYQINMIESKYLLKNIDKIKNQFLYFGPNDSIKESLKIVCNFINSTEEEREKILNENF